MAGGGPAHLLVGVEGAVVGGEADGLVLGLNSYGEEEHQASATEPYLRRGLVEQRELVPVPWSRERPGQPDDLVLAGAAYLDDGGAVHGDQQVAVAETPQALLQWPEVDGKKLTKR